MVTQQVVLTTTRVAAENLTVHRLVGFSGKTFKGVGTELGVAEVSGKKGDAIPVNVMGIMAVEAGAAISAGELLKSDGEGRVIPEAALDKGALPASTVGVAVDSATAAGEIIRMVRGI
ncbi:capsid cement protein [Symbiopectobacterium sp.]|uniref:capsid cement protein n=1 Tax=Symbiopectobacterium sp. TaxID=2952789 RepID=UPI003F2D5598